MNKNKNKTGIISILLSLILILNIIMPINVFADEKTEEKNILNEINSLKEVIKSKKTKDYLDCLTLRALGEPINKQDLNLVENGNSKVNAQNIIKLFSAKEDIKNREYIKYVKVLTDNLNENGFLSAKGNELQDYDLGTTALCIIALELTVSDYNKELASKALIKYVNSELEKDNDQIKDVVSISNTIVALKLLNLENCNENINKFLDIFKYCINYEGKIETDMTWPSYNGSLIQALTLIGEDPTSDNWTSDNDTNLIDGLNAFDCNTDEKKSSKLAALVDYYNFRYGNKNSMFTLDYKIVNPNKIEFENNNIKIKEGKESDLNIKIFDNNDEILLGEKLIFTNHNKDIVELDEQYQKIKALKEGDATIDVALDKNKDIKATLNIEVFKNKASKLSININEDNFPIKVNDLVQLNVEGFDVENDKVHGMNLKYSVDNKNIATVDSNGILKCKNIGNVTVNVSLKEDNSIYAIKEVEVQDNLGLNEISNTDKKRIESEIENLKNYYESETRQGLTPLALSKSGLVKKAYMRKKSVNIYDYSLNIFAALGSNEDPRNYDGINFVEELKKVQVKDGENKGQFIKNEISDLNNLSSQCYSILALDLVKEPYDKKAAVTACIKLYQNKEYGRSSFDELENKALLATVLAGCNKDIEEEKILKNIILDIKNEYLKNGQFDSKSNKSRATALAIQALVANNINPLGKEFTKDNKNLLDLLLSYKSTEPTSRNKYLGFTVGVGYGSNITNPNSTSYALCALVDLYNKESIFGIKSSINIESGEMPEIDVKGIENSKVYNDDVNIEIKSTVGNKWNAKLNDVEFKGGKISKSGVYKLEIEASNENGLKATKIIKFIIDKNQTSSVRLRIEGRDKTIFNKEVKIGDVCNTPLSLLKVAVGLDKVECKSMSSFGEYITSILDTKEKEGDYGWCYSVIKGTNAIFPNESVDKFQIQKNDKGILNVDEIVFYMSDYKGSTVNTIMPIMTYKNIDNNIIINFKNYDKDINGLEVNINNKTYITDKHGNVLLNRNEDTLTVTLGKRNINGGILVVPATYTILLDKNDTSSHKEEILVEDLTDKNSFRLGCKGKVKIKVTNKFLTSKNISFIVGLYDKSNKLVDYVTIENQLAASESIILDGMLLIPNKGEFKVKTFLWDGLNSINSISDPIIINVK